MAKLKQSNILKNVEIKKDGWKKIFEYCSKKKVNIIAEPFDYSSLELIKSFSDIKNIKIPTSDFGDIEFVKNAQNISDMLILGIGGSKHEEIQEIVDIFSNQDKKNISLMHGYQNYPTKLQDLEIKKISFLKDRFGLDVGFADHVDASSSYLSFLIPAMAVSAGAKYIEKHITLNRSKKGPDYYSALNPNEFYDFVKYLKLSSISLERQDFSIMNENERIYREQMKKYAILNRDVEEGTDLSLDDIDFKRTEKKGITKREFLKLKNTILKTNVSKGFIINEKYFR